MMIVNPRYNTPKTQQEALQGGMRNKKVKLTVNKREPHPRGSQSIRSRLLNTTVGRVGDC
jgi:hypothetical protein